MDSKLSDVMEYCKSCGLKFTEGRRIVAETVMASRKHLTAEDIYDILKDSKTPVPRATIYRTLALLKECGCLEEHDFGLGKKYYEYMAGRDHHDHLYCIGCGNVIEFHSDGIEKLQDEVVKKYSFMPLYHSHKIFGYCVKCKDKNVKEDIK